jgi:short-subunit dehydrogenase
MSLPAPARGSACLVTGASSGFGVEFARKLAARGHDLVLVARREERLRSLSEELERTHGISARVAVCDLAAQEERARLLELVAASGLQIEVLVNNAGFSRAGDLHEHAPEQLEMVEVDVLALVELTTAYLPAMVERGRGAVINVASIAGLLPLPTQATYGAAKAFVASFGEALAVEVRRFGVTVTTVAPGPARTEFFEVAGFKRTLIGPSLFWVSAEQVAQAAITGAERGQRLVVPGLIPRAAALIARYTPRPLLLGPFAALWRWGIGE